MRQCGFGLLVTLVILPPILFSQDTKYPPEEQQIPGPLNATQATGDCCARGGERPISVDEPVGVRYTITNNAQSRAEYVISPGWNNRMGKICP